MISSLPHRVMRPPTKNPCFLKTTRALVLRILVHRRAPRVSISPPAALVIKPRLSRRQIWRRRRRRRRQRRRMTMFKVWRVSSWTQRWTSYMLLQSKVRHYGWWRRNLYRVRDLQVSPHHLLTTLLRRLRPCPLARVPHRFIWSRTTFHPFSLLPRLHFVRVKKRNDSTSLRPRTSSIHINNLLLYPNLSD